MNDDHFERSADMRLIELHRRSLGVASPASTWSRSQHELPHASEAPPAPPQTGTIVVANVDAQPHAGLIPGALVTVAIALTNEGDRPASGLHVAMPLPIQTRYHGGTFAVDGQPLDDGAVDAFFGEGIALADLGPGARATVLVRLVVEPGIGDLAIGPHVRITSGAVLGPRAVRLTRGAAPRFAEPPERPFYEPDADEVAAEPVLPAVAVSVLQPREMPPVLAREPVGARPSEPPRAAALPLHAVVRCLGGPVFSVDLDRNRHAMLSGLFGAKSLGMIAHYLLLNALATSNAVGDDGTTGELGAFILNQERLLTRALIVARLGKPVAPEAVAAPLPPFPPPARDHDGALSLAPGPDGTVRLMRAYRKSEMDFLNRMLENADAPVFLRAVQCFVGLGANDVAIAGGTDRRRIGTLLASYAGLAAYEINRIFLRAKITRTPALFKETEPAFDDAARSVLDALGTHFA